MSGMYTSGLIGLTEENVGIDRRFYTNSTDTNPTRAVSYNNGRVDVYLNGVKLVGNHAGNSNHDYTMDNVTGTGTSITLVTDVALTSTDVLELVGYVSNSSNTVQTYNFNVTTNTTAFTASHTASSLVNVYLNGVLLDSSDYTLNGSDTVTLGSNAVNGDVVAIQVIGALDHSNFVPTGGGAFTGPITGVDVNSTELVLDADGDTSITADTDDQIDIKIGGTDVGNFNSDTLKLTKDNTPKLIVEDTNSSDFTLSGNTFWLTAPELQLTHNTSDANADGAIGNIKFQGTTKNNLGVTTSNNTISQIEGRSFEASAGVGQRVTDMKSGFRFRGYDGAGNFGDLMIIKGENLQLQNGGGIDFSAQTTSSASGTTPDTSAGAEVFDHYEKGSWSPLMNTGTWSNQQTAEYIRVGDLVHCYGAMSLSSISGGSTLQLSRLPFPAKNHSRATASGFFAKYVGLSPLTVYLDTTSTIQFYSIASAEWEALNASHCTAGSTYIYFSFTYQTS